MAAPDFVELAQSLNQMGVILSKAGEQVTRVPNILPAATEPSISDQLKKIDESLTDLKRRVSEVHTLAAHAVNGQARQTDTLAVLKDEEGRNIPGFPSTKADVDNLKKDDLVALLRGLGKDTDGTADQLRQRFKAAINVH